MPSRSNNHGPAGQGPIAAQPGLDNVIQGCPCSRNRYSPQMVRLTMEYQDHTGIKISVATTVLPSLLLWTARLRHGLSLHKPRCVVRSSVPCISLKSSSAGSRECWVCTYACRSRPVRSLLRLSSLIYSRHTPNPYTHTL
jgi:hypothetical protein